MSDAAARALSERRELMRHVLKRPAAEFEGSDGSGEFVGPIPYVPVVVLESLAEDDGLLPVQAYPLVLVERDMADDHRSPWRHLWSQLIAWFKRLRRDLTRVFSVNVPDHY